MPPAPSTCSTRYFPASSSPCRIMGSKVIPRDGAPRAEGRPNRRNQLFADRSARCGGVGARRRGRAATLAVDAFIAPGALAIDRADAFLTQAIRATHRARALGAERAFANMRDGVASIASAVSTLGGLATRLALLGVRAHSGDHA